MRRSARAAGCRTIGRAAFAVLAASVVWSAGSAPAAAQEPAETREPAVAPQGAPLQETGPRQPTGPRLIGLEEAVEMALRRSPELYRAEAELDGARADRLQAYGSLVPTVDAGYGYSTSSTGRLDPTGQQITNTSWTAQLTARYDVLGLVRRPSEIGTARGRATAAEARYAERRYGTVLEARTAWFEAAAARQLAEVEEGRVRRQEAQLDSVAVQLDLGQVARTDVLRSEVALNQARLALVAAENAVRTADLALARAIGADEPVAPAAPDVAPPRPLDLSREEVLAAALGRGPSVRSARAEADAADAAVRSARTAFLPELGFAGGWAWSAPEFPPENRSWRVFLFGEVPLFNGFRRENRVWQARSRADAVRADARQAELRLREEVEAAFGQVEASVAAFRLAEATVELAREELEANRERFRFGRGSILELQGAQVALAQAQADLVRARFDYHVGVATLEYLLGAELP